MSKVICSQCKSVADSYEIERDMCFYCMRRLSDKSISVPLTIDDVAVDSISVKLVNKHDNTNVSLYPHLKSYYSITGSIEGKEFYFILPKESWKDYENSNAD